MGCSAYPCIMYGARIPLSLELTLGHWLFLFFSIDQSRTEVRRLVVQETESEVRVGTQYNEQDNMDEMNDCRLGRGRRPHPLL